MGQRCLNIEHMLDHIDHGYDIMIAIKRLDQGIV